MATYTYNAEVAKKQVDLNNANTKTSGYIPLKVDGLLGPLTQTALMKYGGQPQPQNSTIGNQLGAIPSTQPQTPTTNTGGTVTTDAPKSSNPYLDQVMALQKLSPAEVDAQKQLNQLQSNATQGQFNVSQQPVAQTFVSGQQAAMQTQANIAQQPLQLKLALAQAQRQAALDSAKTALDYQKPVSMGYGAQLVNPLTGSTVNGGILGSGTTGSGTINPATGLNSLSTNTDILGYLTSNGIDASRYDMPGLINAVRSGSTAQDIISGRAGAAGAKAAATQGQGYWTDANGNRLQNNPDSISTNSSGNSLGGFSSVQDVKNFQATHGLKVDGIVGPKTRAAMSAAGMSVLSGSSGPMSKADAQSLAEQTKYADTTQRAFNTANDNLNSITAFMQQAGVNTGSTVPLINTLNLKVKGGLLDPGTIAAFHSAIQGLRSEYAQVLSRGGEVTDSARASANSLIPDNLTPSQLQQVASRLNIEGSNAIKEANKQIQVIKDRSSGKSSTSGSGTTIQTKVGAISTDW